MVASVQIMLLQTYADRAEHMASSIVIGIFSCGSYKLMLACVINLHACPLLQTLMTAVAQVGVDINAICANPWRQAPLQFVPGLGPRKARQLLASIAANDNHVKTRVEFFKQASLPAF